MFKPVFKAIHQTAQSGRRKANRNSQWTSDEQNLSKGIDECNSKGKSGPAPSQLLLRVLAIILATATGTKERGRHSESSSSTARRLPPAKLTMLRTSPQQRLVPAELSVRRLSV
jgi:hypothetical protein